MIEPKRILLVDDDARDVTLALKALARYKLANDVTVLRDGAEALDFLFRRGSHAQRSMGQPAVVLLDIKMPGVDGIEVLRQLKSHPELRLLPVVMLTSSQEERDVTGCYNLGVNAYVVKPVQFHAFVDAVGELGLFWAAINEPPPGSVARRTSVTEGTEESAHGA